jgi:hypothetical protein
MSNGTHKLSDTMTRVDEPRLETHWSRVLYVDLFAAEPARHLDPPHRGGERVSEQMAYVRSDAASLWATALAWFGAQRNVRRSSVNWMAD